MNKETNTNKRKYRYETKVDPITAFVSGMISSAISSYRKTKDELSYKFLFEGNILQTFLNDYKFDNIKVDLLRQTILSGKRLNQFK